MRPRRGDSGLAGILLVDKPGGQSSHDVVNRVRRALGERRVGHAGTLDPMATGLLVVLVGPATRLAPYLTAAEKSYEARVAFGSETSTDDAEGTVTRTADVPDFDEAQATRVVESLVGVREQLPPAFSAIKRDGVVAHEAARAGEPIELEPRTIEVLSARLISTDRDSATWDLALTVSKGTYVRAIARDLGRALGSAAHLSALRRTSSGSLTVERAIPLADIESAADADRIAQRFADPVAALGLPAVRVSDEGAIRVSNGSTLDSSAHLTGSCPTAGLVAVVHLDRLLAVYAAKGSALKARVVVPGGLGAGAS